MGDEAFGEYRALSAEGRRRFGRRGGRTGGRQTALSFRPGNGGSKLYKVLARLRAFVIFVFHSPRILSQKIREAWIRTPMLMDEEVEGRPARAEPGSVHGRESVRGNPEVPGLPRLESEAWGTFIQ
jgi:hypothetical protein